jgi:hypothetical protein
VPVLFLIFIEHPAALLRSAPPQFDSRGDFSASSDVDLVIIVDGDLSRTERNKIDDLIADHSLSHDVVISAIVYPSKIFREYSTPFLLSAKEGRITV